MRTFMTRLLAIATMGLAVSCVSATAEPEDTAAACSDGNDNDLDGSADCFDINCIAFPNCSNSLIENCAGGADEDGDGRFDCDDQDCLDQNPDNSTNEQACAPAFEDCVNGIDDDGDGLTDCLDPSCDADPICPDELCNNNADDDGDGDIDCADVECAGDPACDLTEVCDNGADDDNDGQSDCNDADCATAPNCLVENCTDGFDNDGDTFVDCDDANCITAPNCSPNAVCGDGIRNQVTEDCDGADLVGSSCQSLGFQSGTLTCAAGCTFNTSACVAAPTCGNGAIDAGESCDGANLNNQSCISRGFDGGTLSCNAGCQFNEAACVNNAEVCNNGTDDDGDGQADCNDADCSNAPNCGLPGNGSCGDPFIAQPGVTTANEDTNASSSTIHLSAGNGFPGCFVGGFGNPEQVYQITVAASGTLSTNLLADADLGFYIRISPGGPSASNCGNINNEVDCKDSAIGGVAETAAGGVAPGDTFYIFVDGCEQNCQDAQGGDATSGPYTLTITLQ
jgi:hypothetical protein